PRPSRIRDGGVADSGQRAAAFAAVAGVPPEGGRIAPRRNAEILIRNAHSNLHHLVRRAPMTAPTPPAPPAPAPPQPAAATPAGPRRSVVFHFLWLGCLIGLAVLAVPFALSWWSYRTTHSITEDAFVEAHIVNVAPQSVSGRLVRFYVEE